MADMSHWGRTTLHTPLGVHMMIPYSDISDRIVAVFKRTGICAQVMFSLVV